MVTLKSANWPWWIFIARAMLSHPFWSIQLVSEFQSYDFTFRMGGCYVFLIITQTKWNWKATNVLEQLNLVDWTSSHIRKVWAHPSFDSILPLAKLIQISERKTWSERWMLLRFVCHDSKYKPVDPLSADSGNPKSYTTACVWLMY